MNTIAEIGRQAGGVVKRESAASEGADPVVAKLVAQVALQPELAAAGVVGDYSRWIGKPEITALADQLEAWSGEMAGSEAMLHAQSHALHAMFASLVRTAHAQPDHPNWESILRMGLKAQSQCRVTIETLSTIKNPPVVFAKQANFSAGHQQINNGQARVGNDTPVQTKLLESSDAERMDFGAASPTGSAHPQLEAMGALDGSADDGRQGTRVDQRQGLPRRAVARHARDGKALERCVPRPSSKAAPAMRAKRRRA